MIRSVSKLICKNISVSKFFLGLWCVMFGIFLGFLLFISGWHPLTLVMQLIKHIASESNCVSSTHLEHASWLNHILFAFVMFHLEIMFEVRWRKITSSRKLFIFVTSCLLHFTVLVFQWRKKRQPSHEDEVQWQKYRLYSHFSYTYVFNSGTRSCSRTEIPSVSQLCYIYCQQCASTAVVLTSSFRQHLPHI